MLNSEENASFDENWVSLIMWIGKYKKFMTHSSWQLNTSSQFYPLAHLNPDYLSKFTKIK